jgi:hypothetical protein
MGIKPKMSNDLPVVAEGVSVYFLSEKCLKGIAWLFQP